MIAKYLFLLILFIVILIHALQPRSCLGAADLFMSVCVLVFVFTRASGSFRLVASWCIQHWLCLFPRTINNTYSSYLSSFSEEAFLEEMCSVRVRCRVTAVGQQQTRTRELTNSLSDQADLNNCCT